MVFIRKTYKKINEVNAVEVLITMLKYGTFSQEAERENYITDVNFSFVKDINKKQLLDKILTRDIEDIIKRKKYSEGLEALINCIKNLI